MADLSYHGPVVAFDLDDTLFRERDFCRSGFRFLCDRSGYHVLEIEDYPPKADLDRLVSDMDKALAARLNPFDLFDSFFKSLAESHGLEWEIGKHISAYRSHKPYTLNPADGVADTLERLARAGIKMALITDGRSITQRNKIEALGLNRFFAPEMILISEETGHEKSDSKEMFATVVRFFPEASKFFYVGNNPRKDFYFPNLMGWTSICVPEHPDDVHPRCEPPTPLHAPSFTLENFTDLFNLICP